MKIAGIDIDKDAIRVVELQKGMRTFSVASFFCACAEWESLRGVKGGLQKNC